ncbi:MAG: prepilin peptidase [Candidatus Liptonbacteria bacterium]|nr:prepilin peptidase [Candidatus Liptonbacteria bacterium]
MNLLLFFLGAGIGSFLGVIGDRYREGVFILDKSIVGGRSRCETCGKKLRWFELIPVLSFLFQRGRCLSCGRWIGWHYLFTELTSGLLFVFIARKIEYSYYYFTNQNFYLLSAIWIAIFSILLLVLLIDFRLKIIPDELSITLVFLGFLITAIQPLDALTGSFLGHYGSFLGLRSNVWINHIAAAAVAAIFFAFLIAVTKGRGMGGGDLKLVAAIGFIFGWPDILLVMMLAFITGSIFGIIAIALKKEKLKSQIAFGPFIALSAAAVFFFGYEIIDFYLSFLPSQ